MNLSRYVKLPSNTQFAAVRRKKTIHTDTFDPHHPSDPFVSTPPPQADGENVKFQFRQPVPVSSYLIALAAGRMTSQKLSPRVSVWAEPEVTEAAAFEFSQTEEFLQAAESLTCPYVWGRYDVLCLPPSFPYGGMENPCLTFATPTLLAGDKSLADVIAHEIAHSWTGNLVTNHTWEHFWLNEGWTVWLERKIMAKVKGRYGCPEFKKIHINSMERINL